MTAELGDPRSAGSGGWSCFLTTARAGRLRLPREVRPVATLYLGAFAPHWLELTERMAPDTFPRPIAVRTRGRFSIRIPAVLQTWTYTRTHPVVVFATGEHPVEVLVTDARWVLRTAGAGVLDELTSPDGYHSPWITP